MLGLINPDDYRGRPYIALLNQIGHIYVGFNLSIAYLFILDKLAYFPSQAMAFAVIVVVYLFGWELVVQGWRKWDSLVDTLFIGIGGSSLLLVDYEPVINRVFTVLLFAWIPLLIVTMQSARHER